MKKSSILVITIPLVIVVLIIAGVFVMRMVNRPAPESVQLPAAPAAQIPPVASNGSKPTVGFGNLQAEDPVSDLSRQFDTTADDGGASAFADIASQSASL